MRHNLRFILLFSLVFASCSGMGQVSAQLSDSSSEGQGLYSDRAVFFTPEDLGSSAVLSAPPIADFDIIGVVCLGQDALFRDKSTFTGAAVKSVTVNFGDGSSISRNAPLSSNDYTHKYTVLGNYTVTLTVTNTADEVSTTSKAISVYPVPEFAPVDGFSYNLNCKAGTFDSKAFIVDGSEQFFIYEWTYGDGSIEVSGSKSSHTFSNPGTYTVGLKITSDKGCVVKRDQNIVVKKEPTVNFQLPATMCLGGSVQFTDLSVPVPGIPIIGWAWDFGDGNTSTDQHPTHRFNQSGTFTITLSVTTIEGCQTDPKSATKTIVIGSATPPNFTVSPQQLCVGKPVTITDMSAPLFPDPIIQWLWEIDGVADVRSNAMPFTHTFTSAGVHTVSLQLSTQTGCRSTREKRDIQVFDLPVVDFVLPNICLPDGIATFVSTSTADGSSAGLSYAWTFGNGRFAATSPASTTFGAAGSYPITLAVTSPQGCYAEKTKILNSFFNSPSANFDAPPIICALSPALFTDRSTAPANTVVNSWTWDFGDNSTSTLQNPQHIYGGTGLADVSLTIKSDKGCRSTIKKEVTVILNATPDFDFYSNICVNKPASFNDLTSANGSTIVSRTWDYGDGVIETYATSVNPTHTYTQAGDYQVKLTVQTASGCSNLVRKKTITIKGTPNVSFIEPYVCIPSGVARFVNTSTFTDPDNENLYHAWLFSDSPFPVNTQDVNRTFTGTGPHSVALTVSNYYGCSATLQKQITKIYNDPVIDFTANSPACLGVTTQIKDATNAGGAKIVKWDWNLGNSLTETVQNPTVTYTAVGDYPVSLYAETEFGCFATGTKTLSIVDVPVANFNFNAAVCENVPVKITDLSTTNPASPINKWIVDWGDGNSRTYNSANIPSYSYTNAMSATIKLEVENNAGCRSLPFSRTMNFDVKPKSDFAFSSLCLLNTDVEFTDKSTISQGSIVNRVWEIADPAFPGGVTATGLNTTHQFSAANTFPVSLVTTSDKGCTDTLQKQVAVQTVSLVPDFSLVGNALPCGAVNLDIKDNTFLSAGSLNRLEINWDTTNALVTTIDNSPTPGKAYSHSYPAFASPSSKTVTIRYRAILGNNCEKEFLKNITLLAVPVLTLPAVPDVCVNAPAWQVAAPSIPAGVTGTGVFSGASITPAGLFTPSIAGVGAHAIDYSFLLANGCTSKASTTVKVQSLPTVNAGIDRTVFSGESLILSPQVNAGVGYAYQWSPTTFLDDATKPSAMVVAPTDDIKYKLTVTNQIGCSASDEMLVKILKQPIAPNIFSPNGDGVHDTWQIENLSDYPKCEVKIYNRYGQMVKFLSEYKEAWDGRINGKDAPVGTYYYIIYFRNGYPPIKGWVDIIK